MKDERSGPILCFGEVLLRLAAPPGGRLANATQFSAHVGGAEANVAVALAQLGHRVEMVTVVPQTGLGHLCEGELRRFGVGTSRSIRVDGRLGIYFLEPGAAGTARVTYDRAYSAFAEHAGAFDWVEFASTANWLHLSGINLALGEKTASAALAAAEAMRASGIPISFDVNHRASLWQGRSGELLDHVRSLMGMAHLLFASPHDISRVLQVGAEDPRVAAEAAFEAFQGLQFVASTRRSQEGDCQTLSARIDSRESWHETEAAPLRHVIDRIGSGDAFAGAVIDGLKSGVSLERCARQGLAAAVIKHSIAGDRLIGTRADLETFDPFGPGDVLR